MSKTYVDEKVDRMGSWCGSPGSSKGVSAIITGVRAVTLHFSEGSNIITAPEASGEVLE